MVTLVTPLVRPDKADATSGRAIGLECGHGSLHRDRAGGSTEGRKVMGRLVGGGMPASESHRQAMGLVAIHWPW